MLHFSNDYVFGEQLTIIYQDLKVIGAVYSDGVVRIGNYDLTISDLSNLVTKFTNQINSCHE